MKKREIKRRNRLARRTLERYMEEGEDDVHRMLADVHNILEIGEPTEPQMEASVNKLRTFNLKNEFPYLSALPVAFDSTQLNTRYLNIEFGNGATKQHDNAGRKQPYSVVTNFRGVPTLYYATQSDAETVKMWMLDVWGITNSNTVVVGHDQ